MSIWRNGEDLEEISGESDDTTPEILAALDEGMEKELIILYKPFGGNDLFFYDEHLRQILDVFSLYEAKKILFTNQRREAQQTLRGRRLVTCTATMKGRPSRFTRLDIEYNNGNTYSFRDEYSLMAWSVRNPHLYSAVAYIQ